MDSVPEELRTGAVKRLHTLIADMGHLSEAQMAVEKQADQQDKKGGESVHSVLLQGLREMLHAGVQFTARAENANEELSELVQSVTASIDELKNSEDSRLGSAFIGLLEIGRAHV